MRKPLALLTAAIALVTIGGCDDDKDKAKPVAGCDEALTRARQMLAVPDFDAAKDWAGRAKSLCGVDGQKPVAEIEAAITAASDKLKQRDDQALAFVPGVVKAIGAYRALPKREVCDDEHEEDGRCKSTDYVEGYKGVPIQFWTKKGDVTAFSAFTTVSKRGLGCDLFGTAEIKKSRGQGETKALWCAVRSGPLAELDLLLLPSAEGERTDVYAFSPPWLPHDEELGAMIKRFDQP